MNIIKGIMCCLLVLWKSLVDYLRSTPIVRYEQVPFDIDDHVGEEFEQEDTPFLPQSSNTESVEEKNENETKIMDKSECTSPTSLRSYVTAESTSEEDIINEVAC